MTLKSIQALINRKKRCTRQNGTNESSVVSSKKKGQMLRIEVTRTARTGGNTNFAPGRKGAWSTGNVALDVGDGQKKKADRFKKKPQKKKTPLLILERKRLPEPTQKQVEGGGRDGTLSY